MTILETATLSVETDINKRFCNGKNFNRQRDKLTKYRHRLIRGVSENNHVLLISLIKLFFKGLELSFECKYKNRSSVEINFFQLILYNIQKLLTPSSRYFFYYAYYHS